MTSQLNFSAGIAPKEKQKFDPLACNIRSGWHAPRRKAESGLGEIQNFIFQFPTANRHARSFPAAESARAVHERAPLKEGAGKAGRRMHPQPRVQVKKAHEQVTTGSPDRSGLPCAMVLTAYFVLSLVSRAFLPPSPAQRVSVVAVLTPASGRQDHTTIFWYSVKHAETKKTL